MTLPAFAAPQALRLTSRATFSGHSLSKCSTLAPRFSTIPRVARVAPQMISDPPEGVAEQNETETGLGFEETPIDMSSVATATLDPEEEEDSEFEPCAPPQPVLNARAVSEAQQKFKLHETDSGSPEFQIATLTTRIAYLTTHLKENPKDNSSTRGLLKMVSTRRRLLKYVKRQDEKRFDDIISRLKIRVSQQLREL